MKIGIAQINPLTGDLPGNAALLLAAYRECVAAGAELVIAPQLALTGCTPGDLLLDEGFLSAAGSRLASLAAETGPVPFVIGAIEQVGDAPTWPRARNCAAWLENGAVRHRIGKTTLNNSDVHDDARHFLPAQAGPAIRWRDRRIAVGFGRELPAAAENHADLIILLDADPFHLGLPEQRRRELQALAAQTGVPLAWCNAVGGNDHLIYDGNSLFIGPGGRVMAQLAAFAEDRRVLSPAEPPTTPLPPDSEPIAQLFQALCLGLRDYVSKCGFPGVCLGLSGGIDSALVAAIAAAALGPDKVRGLTLPSAVSSRGSVDDSLALGRNLGLRVDVIPIRDSVEAVHGALSPLFSGLPADVTEENIQARLRGVLLMALSNKHGLLLLPCANKSELATGYCTIYGDMCGGLGVIGDLTKGQVYQLARWINHEREVIPWNSINKAPSAELRPDQKDEDSLPPYPELDAAVRTLVEGAENENSAADPETLGWVRGRLAANEWMRRQAAPVLRVSPRAFGPGRRMPLAARFPTNPASPVGRRRSI